jgi:hypothetical protein
VIIAGNCQPILVWKVDRTAWTFGRREERLVLRRETTKDGVWLVVVENGTPRSFLFNDLDRLSSFQSDMEAFLVRSGWTLIEFSPDRRRGRDRRHFPRISERRRWWTDGTDGTPVSRLTCPPRRRRPRRLR